MATGGLRRFWQPLASRPHLVVGVVLGVVTYLATEPWIRHAVTRGLVAWDTAVLAFAILSLADMWDGDDQRMKARAIAHDEGRHFILGFAALAAGASVAAIMAELTGAKEHGQMHEALAVGLTVCTIALSWFFLHLVFALHYAHVYYTARDGDGTPHQGGLSFPDDETPDYWDFLHFAVVIGATAQTADVTITRKEFRRIATVHCLIAFAFNTAILATMINLAAGLF